MKASIWVGGILVILGFVGLFFPKFTTSQTTDLASVGDVFVRNKTISHHIVSPPLTIATLLLGITLIGAGTYIRQTA
jgi:hypothetical protein